ncbi:SMI1/KNR4 family protein [Streptomyces sp. PD-S100-1]|uniref:SMI1/KNR4 family protein n=1 Tax=unclassified Streptomyces TaxID=2593676 RepID=UPI0039BCAB48
MIDWSAEMRRMAAAREKVRQADADSLWRYDTPRPPASPERLREVAERLGHDLDSEYASFLLQADGWPALMQDVDLFGSEELTGPRMDLATELLKTLEPEGLRRSRIDRDALLPIAASTTTIDFFVMPVAEGSGSSPVIWIAGAEVERYPSFLAFFRAMIEENLREANDLRVEG